ncbi:50S ribosomal protein L11 methyltransferase [Tianweitania sp. BSSL-BM11]|uniref:Ribosomal protein L11 methyltransferase n=1 Tax=Tianweitania aestuarii TaxID=2814886 RepID=A0ABS5RVV7_9HYPH|nr:50S ribosomal protein L11 methyltransferase [Tianweitania aestuarii]MBS9720905.1 50S ribosomal protein L11 methyltransferase [Tianweitania aestuarii]
MVDQVRLFVVGEGKAVRDLHRTLETLFEEDGYPIALVELDEAADRHEISIYADAEDETAEERIRSAAPDTEINREDLPEIDWVTASLQGLKPVRAGRFLVHGHHDRDRLQANDIGIEIEAGLAFGTGHHGTTAGCLTVIGEIIRRENPRWMLDLGTGSAVLAIAMAKLTRRPVLATDIDPVAVRVAVENARLNHVGDLVRGKTAVGFANNAIAAAAPFDLIVANILAKPLMRLAPEMRNHLVPGGSVILSGILQRQRNAVIAAYVAQGFRHVRTLPLEGWVTLHLKR